MKRIAIIMAGGSGERFWPLSRKSHPKQLLPLGQTENTMLQEAVDRIRGIIEPEDIFIVTSEILQKPIQDSFAIPKENVIAEPYKRNTASCLALGVSYVLARYKDSHISVAVLTADHIIQTTDQFQSTVTRALQYAEENKKITIIGIPPTRPETGYGYIEKGNLLTTDQEKIYRVLQFREKPNEITAEKYVENGNFLWNSGMFFFPIETFIKEFQTHLPEIGNYIQTLSQTYRNNNVSQRNEIFRIFPDISIDFGVIEKSQSVVMTPADFQWDDVGDINSIERTKKTDKNGNITIGAHSIIKSHNCILINQSRNEKIVATVGMHNTAIILTDDAVLVCNRNDVQNIKKAVADIRKNYGEQYL